MEDHRVELHPTDERMVDFCRHGSQVLADYIDELIAERLQTMDAPPDLESMKPLMRAAMRDHEVAFHALRSLMFKDDESDQIAREKIAAIIR